MCFYTGVAPLLHIGVYTHCPRYCPLHCPLHSLKSMDNVTGIPCFLAPPSHCKRVLSYLRAIGWKKNAFHVVLDRLAVRTSLRAIQVISHQCPNTCFQERHKVTKTRFTANSSIIPATSDRFSWSQTHVSWYRRRSRSAGKR